jgi:ATP-dependent Lhr-like helicase
MNRRFLDAETAADLGKLDQAAIDRVREEAWPQAETADELHDALMQLGFITNEEGSRNSWQPLFDQLVAERRATVLNPCAEIEPQRTPRVSQRNAEGDSVKSLWVAAERLHQLRAVYPQATLTPPTEPPASVAGEQWTAEEALVEILRGRLEALGPVNVPALAKSFSLSPAKIEIGLAKLETEGFVMQGQFTPGGTQPSPAAELGGEDARLPIQFTPGGTRLAVELAGDARLSIEWCSRRLLARIHRYTLNRLRKEIEPVSAADFMRFLFVWQKVSADHKVEGPQSVAAILDQLEGFEAPAGSWESEILPARVTDYDPAWLDSLCVSGKLTWLRLSPPKLSPEKTSSSAPVRSTPIVLLNRRNILVWNRAYPIPAEANGAQLSTNTETVYEYLKEQGASFFHDIVTGTALLPAMVEESLGELVFRGLVTADSFTGLRALITPLSKTTNRAVDRRRRRGKPVYSMDDAGRWVRPRRDLRPPESSGPVVTETDREIIEAVAQKLLQRYGVIFRKLLDRESISVPWRDLLRVLRRLEARGEIRGGRFVGGFSGEQFATAEAVQLLRSIRRTDADGSMIAVSAADPLNLLGIIIPGARLSPAASNRVLYRDGIPIAVLDAKELRFLIEMTAAEQWQARNALLRRHVPPKVRAYLNQTGRSVSPPQSVSTLTH